MTGAAVIVSVERVEDDGVTCRACGGIIRRGGRAVLVLGLGQVHLRCLITPPPGPEDDRR